MITWFRHYSFNMKAWFLPCTQDDLTRMPMICSNWSLSPRIQLNVPIRPQLTYTKRQWFNCHAGADWLVGMLALLAVAATDLMWTVLPSTSTIFVNWNAYNDAQSSGSGSSIKKEDIPAFWDIIPLFKDVDTWYLNSFSDKTRPFIPKLHPFHTKNKDIYTNIPSLCERFCIWRR